MFVGKRLVEPIALEMVAPEYKDERESSGEGNEDFRHLSGVIVLGSANWLEVDFVVDSS